MASSSPPTQRGSTQPFSSPSTSPQPSFPSRFYNSRILHVADISYPESYLRTPLPLLPFQHPKWLIQPPCEDTSPIVGAYEYDESGEEVLESIERPDESREGVLEKVWGDGKREWTFWEERVSSKRGWTVMEERGSLKRERDDLGEDMRTKKKNFRA